MFYVSHLTHYLWASAQQYADNSVLIIEDKAISYAQLLRQSQQCASFLKYAGLQRGDRVVVATGNSLETVIAFWGTLFADGVISIIDPTQSQEKIDYIIRDSGAKVFMDKTIHWLEIIDNFEPIQINPTQLDIDLAAIIYTSGSTGEPKGVMLTHRNMVAAAQSINHYLQNTANDKVISALPLSFDYGLYQMLLMAAVGGTLILLPDFLLPSQLLKKIGEYQATAVPVVPSMVPLLKQFQAKKPFDTRSVRYTSNTGAALHAHHIQDLQAIFPQAAIFSMYGLTECKRCTYLPPHDIQRKSESIGIPIPNTEMWIVDGNGQRVAPNTLGEIVVRGATVMKGYWNKPKATEKKLKPGLLPDEYVLYTGDYGKMDEEGYFYFYGRMDEVIKSRGLKVSPKEIEAVVNAHPDIHESAAVAVDHAHYGQAIVLFIHILRVGMNGDLQAHIAAYCQEKLAPHQRPVDIIHFPSLPKTSNGKIDKKILKAHYQEMAR